MMKRVLVVGTLLLLIIAGLILIQPKKEQAKEGDTFYKINTSENIKYAFPSRPFDSTVTLESVGWHKGKFTAIISTKLYNENEYSSAFKFFSPTIHYKNKKYILMDKIWVSGALEGYKNSISTYAITSKNPSVPEGEWPDKITMNGVEFKLPPKPTKVASIPTFKPLVKKTSDLKSEIKLGEKIYKISAFDFTSKGGSVSLNVNVSGEGLKENRTFLLKDEHDRIYSFKRSTLPIDYQQGDNHAELELNQPISNDATHLEFVVADAEFVQSFLYKVKDEKSTILYEK
ncbi:MULTISPECIES: hypothetical protein [unclassified Bacillus (in: firmicutes)]|uniref:hypothetical protein n=1 Tax=unclassified Bacillus (in: firmicutes) TaxID=185979 RepID=UPI0008EAE710|nr:MULTISPECIES: hypothetical protein [unclassified Bacillus (in: firmicutes)]SFB13339.1 hypothetical protein SAMN02799634_106189 [Bacillus sp. UNCCL13]SFQ90040.1 hypothetical protein SAMN04488577_3630 [Bacillus sp. cl95]